MAHPCRLFVILARDAAVAAVIRRGPSDWYQVLRWDTSVDHFADGAWFKGRIYEDRCDVSPDGELLLYFCHGGRSRPGYTDSWTAVSRLPWLSALALWPSGTTYGGGGRFVDRRSLILRQGRDATPHPDHVPQGLTLVDGPAPRQNSLAEIEGAQWSGYDQAGRLVYAQAGKLFARVGGNDHELVDLNGRKPYPTRAPASATRTPRTSPRRSHKPSP